MKEIFWYLILVATQGSGLEVETVRFSDSDACQAALVQMTKGGGQASFSTSDHRILKLMDGSVKITGYCVASGTIPPPAQ